MNRDLVPPSTPTDVGLAPRVPSDDTGLAPRSTTAMPPSDLLSRCLSTIPDTATYRTPAPRPLPDAASRKRLAWLTVAAAVPVITVLAVLPAKLWLSYNSVSSRKKSEILQKLNATKYVRIHQWRRIEEQNALSQPDYRVLIYDAKRGKTEWQTDATYITSKVPADTTPFALIDQNSDDGKHYTT